MTSHSGMLDALERAKVVNSGLEELGAELAELHAAKALDGWNVFL